MFGRTTTPLQTEITQEIFLKPERNRYLKERVTTQLYCEEHRAFPADRFVGGECPLCSCGDALGDQCDLCGDLVEPLELIRPRCKIDGATSVTRDTKHVFLELDKLQPEVEGFFREASVMDEWSANGKAITAGWLTRGLQSRSITRDMRWDRCASARLRGESDLLVVRRVYRLCFDHRLLHGPMGEVVALLPTVCSARNRR